MALPNDGYFYDYNADFAGTIAANTTAQTTINIDGSSYFDVIKMSYYCADPASTITENTRLIPGILIQILDTDSNEAWFNSPTYVGSIFGTGVIPYILPRPRRIAPRAVVQVTATNLDNQARRLQLTFSGLRIRLVPNS